MYKNGLSRSDVGHIKMANALPIIINSIFILNYLINYLFNKKNYTKIFNYKNAFSISIIFLIIFYTLGYKKYKIENIVNFNKNFTKYIYLDDEDFLNNKEIKLLNN